MTSDRSLLPLAAITAVGALARFSTLDAQSYELDEIVTVGLLDGSFGDMLAGVPESESTPPLYYALAWAWAKLCGTGEVGLRSLSALIGTATIPAAYVATCVLVSRRAALVAAALVALNPFLVWHSQQARAYALLALLAALGLWLFARALRDPAPRDLAAWAVVSIAALATHYFALFVVVPMAGWLLWRTPARRAVTVAVGTVALGGLALLPLALEQRSAGRAERLIEISGSLATRTASVPKQFLLGFDAPLEIPLALVGAALCAAALWLLLARGAPGHRRGAFVAAALGTVALALPLVGALGGLDYMLTRNLIGALPLLAVVVGAGCASAGRAGAWIAAGLCLLFAAVVVAVAVDPLYQRDDWRGAAEALGEPGAARVVIATPASPAAMLHYLPRSRQADPPGHAVTEIAYVGLAPHERGVARRPPRPSAAPAPPGFRETGRFEAETFTVIRLRRRRPAQVGRLGARGLDGQPGAVLLQGPGG